MTYRFSCTASFGATVAVLLFSLTAPAARADLKIVSEITVSNAVPNGANPAEAQHSTVTTSYKGRFARMERSDGTVTLFDRAGDKVYTFAPDRKTYYVRSFSETLKSGDELPDTLKDQMKLDTRVKLDAVKSGDAIETRAVAGQDAARYSLLASVRLEPKSDGAMIGGFSGGGGRGGGRGGGGGFPGGGGGGRGGGFPGGGGMPGGNGGGRGRQGGGTSSGGSRESFSVGGELWAADAEKLLPNGKKDEKEMALALVSQMLPANSPALQEVSNQLAKKHLLPLSARMTQSVPASGGQSTGTSGPQPAGPQLQTPQTVELKVVSIDGSVSLPDTLFRVPEGYDRIDPPTATSPFTSAGNRGKRGNGGSGGPPPPP